MSGNTNDRRGDAAQPERGRAVEETSQRVLYWWHVPERPGTGKAMLIFAGAWLLTLLALAVVIRVIFGVVG